MFLRIVERGYRDSRFYGHQDFIRDGMVYVLDTDDLVVEKVSIEDIRKSDVEVPNLDKPYSFRGYNQLRIVSKVNNFIYEVSAHMGHIVCIKDKSYRFVGDMQYNGVYSLSVNGKLIFTRDLYGVPDSLDFGFLYFFKLGDIIIGRWSVEYSYSNGLSEQLVVSFIWNVNGVLLGVLPEKNSLRKIKLNYISSKDVIAKLGLLDLEY